MRGEFARGGLLPHLLLRYAMALTVQTGQKVVCNRHHSVRQQLCSLLLSSMDRLHSVELKITHELIADELGVRRESVTCAMAELRALGMISCSRGRIVLLNRAGLEAGSCKCYAVVKHEHECVLSEGAHVH